MDLYLEAGLSNPDDSTILIDSNIRRLGTQKSFATPVAEVIETTVHAYFKVLTVRTRFYDAIRKPHIDREI